MPIQTWGDMEKNQVDPEKIEEAIDRIVAAHNDDPEAHLGADQSLASHKGYEIIDHVVRSVVRDKINFDRFQIDEHFSTIDTWTKTAGVTLDAISHCTLYTGSTINTERRLYAQPGDTMIEQTLVTQHPTWETQVALADIDNQIAYIIQGDESDYAGRGFKIINNEIFYCWWGTDDVEHTGKVGEITENKWIRYRCEVTSDLDIKFYLDNELVHTEVAPAMKESVMFMYYYIKNTAANGKYLTVAGLHWDADYLA